MESPSPVPPVLPRMALLHTVKTLEYTRLMFRRYAYARIRYRGHSSASAARDIDTCTLPPGLL
jgi:hypothetical protein